MPDLTTLGWRLVLIAQTELGDITDEGRLDVVTVREQDERLGPLINGLIGLGIVALVATALYWWMTRPGRGRTVDG